MSNTKHAAEHKEVFEDSFTAADMADAAAQGFRDGVASVGETVGVEGLPERWRREAPQAGVDSGEDAARAYREAVYWCAFQLEAALAQQPAAVDDAMVELAVAGYAAGPWAAFSPEASREAHRERMRAALQAALAHQPASDGGFTAADMMDARQEGRKEAQQSAAVDEACAWSIDTVDESCKHDFRRDEDNGGNCCQLCDEVKP